MSYRTMLRAFSIALCATALFAADQPSGRAPGLKANVEILVDRWGVPHIYAQNLHDAYFAQGWNAASQRLWQMDLSRKRGLGLLSADFGEAYVAQDRAARLMLYRGDVEAEWKLYTPGMRQVLEAFTEGINAWVRITEQDPHRLSWEFRLTASKPAFWKATDLLIIRSAALSANLSSEVDRAKLACKVGVNAPTLRERLTVPWTPQAPEGLDLCSIPERVLDEYRLGRQTAVSFGAAKGKPAAEGDAPPQVESNNWAVAAQRSATGRAILATDPHRPFSVPAFRYFAHLSYPGLDVIGFGEPQHPGFVFGHNDSIAWGQTTYQVDMEDLYVYEVGAGDSYKYRGEWRPMKIVRDHVPVKGGGSREVTLKFTQHGPVIFEDSSKHRAYALRTAWLEPGSATFLGSIGLNKARNWDEFSQELNRYRVPGNNVIYADVKGNVGLAPVGNAPRRPNWDGLYPVPGDGRYEWEGIRPNSELPRTYNPTDGFVASANNLPYWLPPKEYAAKKIGFEFGQDRIARIREVLGGSGKITFETALKLQNDYKVGAAARLIPYAKGVRGAEMLADWDLVLTKDSAPGALYELWVIELISARAGTVDAGRPADVWLKGMAAAERGRVVNKTLAAAIAHAEQLMGHDPKQWAWGKLHHLRLEHALSPVADAALRDKINVGGRSAGKGGESSTVGNLGYDRKTFRITSGNSSRFVIDVGNWDASRFLHVPGQSGDPDSAEYRNLLESWVKEEYNPLLYTRKAVEAATVRRVVLTP